MKKVEINAYTYQELSPQAQKEAWYGFYAPILEENVDIIKKDEVECFRSFLEDKLKLTDVDIYWSCGKSQGDGASFSGKFGEWLPEKHKALAEVPELAEMMQSKEAQAFLEVLENYTDLSVTVCITQNHWATLYAHENTVGISYTVDGDDNIEDTQKRHGVNQIIQTFLENTLERRLRELMREFHERLEMLHDEGYKAVEERAELIEQGYFEGTAWFTEDGKWLKLRQ